jgi:ABC-2 type transport system permease protein
MLWKEFIQMRRDRLTLGMMVGLPMVQLLLFGYAIQTDIRHVPLVVLDESRSAESRALVDVLRNSGTFDVVGTVPSREAARRTVERGEAAAALVVPPDYHRRILRRETADAQLLVDAADPQTASAAMSGAQLAAQARNTVLLEERFGDAVRPPVALAVRPWYNPEQASAVYIVPGIVGVLLTITMTLVTGTAIVRERERGTLEQLIVTPIDRTSLMLGKLIPFSLVGYVQMTLVLLLGAVIFDVPFRGPLPVLYAVAFLFITASLGIGLLISTVAKSQAQAMQLAFFFMLPNILLSGYIFPRPAMPAPAQWLGGLLPLTYFLEVLRGVLLKGVGFDAVWRQAAVLGAFTVVLMTVAVQRFHKTLD